MNNEDVLLVPYHKKSQSAKDLARHIPCRKTGEMFMGMGLGRKNLIINWGNKTLPNLVHKAGCMIFNHPEHVKNVSNKRLFFKYYFPRMNVLINHDDTYCVPWTESTDTAFAWLQDGHKVFARTKVSASGGQGIYVLDPENGDDDPDNDWPDEAQGCRLFTKYIPKRYEFRVHFAFNKVIAIQRKGLRHGEDKHENKFLIQNWENGFVYIRNNIIPPEKVMSACYNFIDSTPLHFGAIDVIYNQKHNAAYILEVNSAPGLEGRTLIDYSQAFRDKIINI
jgi:hypothetical protein